MDINPMMLLPLLMQGNKGGDNADMTKMMTMLNALKSGKPEDIMQTLGGDNEKLKMLMTLLNQNSAQQNPSTENDAETASYRPSTAFAGEEINAVLSRLMKK